LQQREDNTRPNATIRHSKNSSFQNTNQTQLFEASPPFPKATSIAARMTQILADLNGFFSPAAKILYLK
jgi:hypothetical protein